MNVGRTLAVAILLAACALPGDHTAGTQASLNVLRLQVDSLRVSVDSLNGHFMDLYLRFWRDSVSNAAGKSAYLTPGDNGFSTVRTSLGAITVALVNVQAYASGSRIQLRVGNPTSATITGLQATIEYGRVDSAGMPLDKDEKSKEVAFAESLAPGKWTVLAVVLDNLPPSAIGFVEIHDVSFRSISLGSQ